MGPRTPDTDDGQPPVPRRNADGHVMRFRTLGSTFLIVTVVAACATGTAAIASDAATSIDPTRTAPAAPPAATPTPEPTRSATPTPTSPSTASPTPAPTTTPTPTPTPIPVGAAPTGPTERAIVLSVIDGDTIKVDRGQGPENVRYIGIDTPETVHPGQPVEWMGREASEANRGLVEGREVVLEIDVSNTDQYGRLLRYVWTEETGGWRLVNLALLAMGVAQVSTYPPDVKYVDLYLVEQRAAREAGLGLWGAPPEPTPAPRPDPTVVPPAPLVGNCHASYPAVCIPPAPPDLDCGQIPHRRFEVVGEDPHGFDGNHDGVGCESD